MAITNTKADKLHVPVKRFPADLTIHVTFLTGKQHTDSVKKPTPVIKIVSPVIIAS